MFVDVVIFLSFERKFIAFKVDFIVLLSIHSYFKESITLKIILTSKIIMLQKYKM